MKLKSPNVHWEIQGGGGVLGHSAGYLDFYLRVIPVLIQLGTLS